MRCQMFSVIHYCTSPRQHGSIFLFIIDKEKVVNRTWERTNQNENMIKLFIEFVLVPIYAMSEVYYFVTSNHVFIWNLLSHVSRYGKEKVTKQRQSKRKNSQEKNCFKCRQWVLVLFVTMKSWCHTTFEAYSRKLSRNPSWHIWLRFVCHSFVLLIFGRHPRSITEQTLSNVKSIFQLRSIKKEMKISPEKNYSWHDLQQCRAGAYKSERHITFEAYSKPFSRHQSWELVV